MAVKSEPDDPGKYKYRIIYPEWNNALSYFFHIEMEDTMVTVMDARYWFLREPRRMEKVVSNHCICSFQNESSSLICLLTQSGLKNHFNGNWRFSLSVSARLLYGLIVSSVQTNILGFGKCLSLHWWIHTCQNCTKQPVVSIKIKGKVFLAWALDETISICLKGSLVSSWCKWIWNYLVQDQLLIHAFGNNQDGYVKTWPFHLLYHSKPDANKGFIYLQMQCGVGLVCAFRICFHKLM